MDKKINVILLSIWYPIAMASYFRRALERRPDVNLITAGPYTATWIPWLGGMNLPAKYANPPTFPLPFPPNIGRVPFEIVRAQLPNDWEPDLVLTVDAGICWMSKPIRSGIVAHVATDPHVLNYDYQRQISDKFFNMQKFYMQAKGDIYLPYAFDPTVHYKDDTVSKDTDAALIGMPYPLRISWVEALRRGGMSVLFENGPIFDEYRQLSNRASIGLNWSSLQDMNARVFELMGMNLCPVTNRVPDLTLFFEEDRDYLGFSSLEEAIEKALYAKANPEKAKIIANNAYDHVLNNNHTYGNRVETVLKECGLL